MTTGVGVESFDFSASTSIVYFEVSRENKHNPLCKSHWTVSGRNIRYVYHKVSEKKKKLSAYTVIPTGDSSSFTRFSRKRQKKRLFIKYQQNYRGLRSVKDCNPLHSNLSRQAVLKKRHWLSYTLNFTFSF